MTTITMGSHAAHSPHRSGLAGMLVRIGHAFTLRRAARAMEGLDDHMLHDLGITRGEVEIAVRSGRTGLGR